MLASLTNQQSHADGILSDDEYRWLTMRAQGGFGLTMTCASHVDARGQGFRGQLGCFGDEHVPGLQRLAKGLNAAGTLSVVQLHHAGRRSPLAATLAGIGSLPPEQREAAGKRANEVRRVIGSALTERQAALARGSARWLAMSAEDREQAKGRFEKWQKLTPEQREFTETIRNSGNALLAIALVMMFFLGQLWAWLGSWAMALWMVLAGTGMTLVMRDAGPGSNLPD